MASEPKPRPEDFFFAGAEPADDMRFLAPLRAGVLLEPIVDAIEAFAAMERAIWGAKKTVDLAFWIFNPATGVQARERTEWGVKTWSDLLVAKARAGVLVRLLLTDFDPILSPDNHRQNWQAYREMVLAATRAGEKRKQLQTICSLHPHAITPELPISFVVSGKLNDHVALLNKKLKEDEAAAKALYGSWPGLWPLVEFQARKKRFARREDAAVRIRPVAHHQKMCIVDQQTAFLGGLDIQTGRIADQAHARYIHVWHDIQARIVGAAEDVARNFIGRWNVEVPLFTAFVEAVNKTYPPTPLVASGAEANARLETSRRRGLGGERTPLAAERPGAGAVQIHRTMTASGKGRLPQVVQRDLRDGWEKAIGQARQFIYMENQYVRSPELAQWVLDRAVKVKELRVIIVVPVAPEEVGETGKGDDVTEHGLALQAEVFKSLREGLQGRVGIFSALLKLPVRKGTDKGVHLHNSPQIYVHSKLILIDDAYANISSANANPRSFYVDSEIAAAWYEPAAVKQLRLKLWRELLQKDGLENWKPAEVVDRWKEIAQANAKITADPKKRTGFIVPHDETKFPGSKSTFLPNEFALLERPQGVRELERTLPA
ncbi:phosphatidylserine/phosphatidylglycerophosphate/cardiolipin synthase-like enzyme [Bradyrhizobium japonicum]